MGLLGEIVRDPATAHTGNKRTEEMAEI